MSRDLPAGVSYQHRPDRPKRPHRFGAYDAIARKYRWQTFSDYGKGLAWAKHERQEIERGESTAVRPLLTEVGQAYIANLRSKNAHSESIRQAEVVIAELTRYGVHDLADESVPARVQRWLDDLRDGRRKHLPAGPASPRTKRKRLTVARVMCHLAMRLPGRPLRFDPLLAISLPKVERQSKPVFSVAELRRLLSDGSRWKYRDQRSEVEAAVAAAGGNKRAAAAALGVNLGTIYNRLSKEDEEDPWWLFTALAIFTGCRGTEVQSLRWEWIRWAEETIFLPASCPGNKMKLERLIPMQKELVDILKERMRVGVEGPILPEAFTSLCPADRSSAFQRYVARCGVEVAGRGPHSLRHGCGALLTAIQTHPMHVMLHLGHDNAKVSHDYVRTATRFRLDVRGWDRFYLRDEPPAAAASPSIPQVGTSPA